MGLSKKFQILLILFFAFLGSFFIAQNTKAEEIQPPVILNAFQVDYDEYVKIQTEGLINPNSDVFIYINQKYHNLANIKKIDNETNKFYYESDLIKKGAVFEIMVIAQDKTSLVLSAPSIMTVKSIIVKNKANSVEILAENQEKKVILAKNLTYFEKKDEILAKNLSIASNKKSSLMLDKKNSAPTLILPTLKNAIGTPKPFITGLTLNNTLVHIYIDGIYNGKTQILNHSSGVANFAYKPFLNLNVGRRVVWAIAENEQGQKSSKSNILEFVVEHPMPAPTLLTPFGKIIDPANPYISGLAKNDSFIKIFINNELEKTFSIKNDFSGVGNFAYISKKPLNRGSHLVYATATDKRGKESKWSNIRYFSKYKPKLTATNTVDKAISGKISSASAISVDVGIVSDFSNILKETPSVPSEQDSLLGQDSEEQASVAREEKNNFKVNLIIFLLFLVLIIVWMFLVNKELKNEKEGKDRKL